MVPVNFSVSSQGNATWVILATTNTRRLRKILFAARGREEDICQNIVSVRLISHHSDFFISWIQRLFSSTRLNCSVQKLICRTQISNGVDADSTEAPHTVYHTYKDHLWKLKTQPEKLLHVSEVTGCCFVLSFQGLEDSKGFINGIISTIIRSFAVTLALRCTRVVALVRSDTSTRSSNN